MLRLLPRRYRPSVILRQRAMANGIFGTSRVWKVVGIYFIGSGLLKRYAGKQPEAVYKTRIGAGRFIDITTSKPLSRKDKRRLRKAGTPTPTLKELRAEKSALAHSLSRQS